MPVIELDSGTGRLFGRTGTVKVNDSEGIHPDSSRGIHLFHGQIHPLPNGLSVISPLPAQRQHGSYPHFPLDGAGRKHDGSAGEQSIEDPGAAVCQISPREAAPALDATWIRMSAFSSATCARLKSVLGSGFLSRSSARSRARCART